MKKLLLIIALCPILCSASPLNLKLGVNAGVDLGRRMNTPGLGAFKTRPGFYCSAKVLSEWRFWQLGIGIEAGTINAYTSYLLQPYEPFNQQHVVTRVASPFINPHFVANGKVPVPKGYFYLGMMAGYMLAYGKSSSPVYNAATNTYNGKLVLDGGHCGNIGMQTGVVLKIMPRMAVNGELAFRRADLTEPFAPQKVKYEIVYFIFSGGLRYYL